MYEIKLQQQAKLIEFKMKNWHTKAIRIINNKRQYNALKREKKASKMHEINNENGHEM